MAATAPPFPPMRTYNDTRTALGITQQVAYAIRRDIDQFLYARGWTERSDMRCDAGRALKASCIRRMLVVYRPYFTLGLSTRIARMAIKKLVDLNIHSIRNRKLSAENPCQLFHDFRMIQ